MSTGRTTASVGGSRKRPARGFQPLGYAKRLSPCKSSPLGRFGKVFQFRLDSCRRLVDPPDSDKGRCGDTVPERADRPQELSRKIEQLADAIQQANYMVVHTGAGMSTAAGTPKVPLRPYIAPCGSIRSSLRGVRGLLRGCPGIPDFRGRHGIWTKEKKGERRGVLGLGLRTC
jgi:hypothetical protein